MTEKDIGHKGQMISSASDHMHIDPLKQRKKGRRWQLGVKVHDSFPACRATESAVFAETKSTAMCFWMTYKKWQGFVQKLETTMSR